MAEGIEVRHAKGCRSATGGRCTCEPTYRASVWSNREHKRIRKTFSSVAEAKSWRADSLVALSKGVLRAPKPTTLQEAWDEWYDGARRGTIRNRSGDQFKPSALRAYEGAMRIRVLPALGPARLADLGRPDLQEFADQLLAEGLSPSAIQVALLPIRAIYRRAIGRGELVVNPCSGLHLPAVRGRRERYASPSEAEALIAGAPRRDREIWATAMYAGLRLGELRALRVEDVDLAAGVIRVERGWNPAEGEIKLKSHAGRRKVPVAAVLRDHLLDLLGRSGRTGSDLVFGRTANSPFAANMLQRRGDKAWKAAGLERLTPHECRHTFASLMIAAGVNAKALSTFMGHAKIGITLDRYGHLMPGSEEEAAGLLNSYLEASAEREADQARAAVPSAAGQSRDNDARIRRLEATPGDSKMA
jgi:integrase